MLTREQILAAKDLPTQELEIPEWGGVVLVRGATAADRDAYEQSLVTTKMVGEKPEVKTDLANAKARLLVKCLVDGEGNRLFKDSEAEDLGKKSAKVVNRVFEVVQDLSGMSRASREALGKNSGAAQAEDSPSA